MSSVLVVEAVGAEEVAVAVPGAAEVEAGAAITSGGAGPGEEALPEAEDGAEL